MNKRTLVGIGFTVVILVLSLALDFVGGCIDHYALVRVTVRDMATGEPITNEPYRVSCDFPCFSWGKVPWSSHRDVSIEKTVMPDDGGVKWFWGHGNTTKAYACLKRPPVGYYRSSENSVATMHFSILMTLIPMPLHFPPIRFATVYARRQMNPIEVETRYMKDLCGPESNGVYLAKWHPSDKEEGPITNSYEVTMTYDCMVGDYCPPYGKGRIPDIVFRHTYENFGMTTNRFGGPRHDYFRKRTMSFPGKGNGLLFRERPTTMNGHEFTADDFTAPEEGYLQEIVSAYGRELIGPTYAFFVFRIRCEHEASGEMTSCYYGCWDGRFSYYLGLSGYYFINPTPMDRNLELKNGIDQRGRAIWEWW